MEVREYEKKDLDEVKRLFYDTVHSVNRKDYDEKQTEAWAPSDMNYTHLEEALSEVLHPSLMLRGWSFRSLSLLRASRRMLPYLIRGIEV